MAAAKLTDKQKRFCEEYLKDLNATQAAIRAGYSAKTANSVGPENLVKPCIQAEIKRMQDARSERTKIDQDYVLKGFKAVFERCMQAEPVMIKEKGKLVESGEYQFNSSGANTALIWLGKHLGMFADLHKHEHTGAIELTQTEKIIMLIAEERAKVNGNPRLKDIQN